MPELPEVEVTKRGIEPALSGQIINKVFFDNKPLRKPFNDNLRLLEGATVLSVSRRAKYILINTSSGTLMIHLGMTGHLSVNKSIPQSYGAHEHFALELSNNQAVVLNDIRRFGLVLFFPKGCKVEDSAELKNLGPEPLTDDFNGNYLQEKLSRYKKSIKQSLMDNKIVVGIGNIYASEILFASGIRPDTLSNLLSSDQCKKIVSNTKRILNESILKGGTTIRDFSGADGKLGYFVQNLKVYGHGGEKCSICGHTIEKMVQGQRSTYFCPYCQK